VVDARRGAVVLCDFSPVVGTEQSGLRPAVVVQIDRANAASPHTIVVPFTTRIHRAVLPSHYLVAAGNNGLTQDSVALCEQVRVIDKKRIVKQLGALSDSDMKGIESGLRLIMGL